MVICLKGNEIESSDIVLHIFETENKFKLQVKSIWKKKISKDTGINYQNLNLKTVKLVYKEMKESCE
jgi:hypothetical protein